MAVNKTLSVNGETVVIAISLALLIKPLRELMRVFLSLELRLLRGDAQEIADYLKRGDAALAIASPLGETWERLDVWPLFTEGFHAVVGPAHGLAAASTVALKDLACERLLAPYCELAEAFAEYCRERGVSWSGQHEMICEGDLVQLVACGLGIAILPQSAQGASGLTRLAVEDLELMRQVALYGVAGRERPAAAAALLKHLRARDRAPAVA